MAVSLESVSEKLSTVTVENREMVIPVEDILRDAGISSIDVITHDGPMFANVFPNIDINIAKEIDSQLDWEDAVSFTFLVVQKEATAIQLCRTIEKNERNNFSNNNERNIGIVEVMFQAAQRHQANTNNWQIRVYQALFLVGYKKLLYDLGIDDEDAEQKFLEGVHVKSDRKLLFKLCQELEMTDQAKIILKFNENQVYNDNATSVRDLTMMESHFLALLVSHRGDTVCQFVKQCLQQMQRADLVNIFEQETCGLNTCKTHLRTPETGVEYYEQGPGLAVVINQKIFYKDSLHPNAIELEDRLGTDRDRDELEATFTMFGADCKIFNDLTHEEMQDTLEGMARKANNKKYCWVAVCVLTHGRRLNGVDEILGCNGVGVDRKKVINMFADAAKCPNLQNKPKIFFFQACRSKPENSGTEVKLTITKDGNTTVQHQLPSDYMVASATIEDFVTYRSTTDGSFFIRHLCEELQKHGHEESLADVMTIVNRKVAAHRPDYPSMPEYTSTMKKKFQFKRTKESITNGMEKKCKNALFYKLQNEFIADRINTSFQY